MTTIPLHGRCDARFAPVREAFETNFTERTEPGAAIALYVDGKKVVDMWGGYSDLARTRSWREDTLVNFFSVGKAMSALVALQLMDRALLDLDTPVAVLWPEFAAHGKEAITPRHLLAHQAGLPGIRELLPDGAMLDWEMMIHALERQAPWWKPGAAHGYHTNTFGFLVGEVVRRAGGETLGTQLRERVAKPLGADIFIGLPKEEHHRVADFHWPMAGETAATADVDPRLLEGENLMRWCTYWNPRGLSGAGWVNTPEWRSAEIPSTNGHGTARGVARVYAALVNGGAIDGVRVVTEHMLNLGTQEQSSGTDLILQRPNRFAVGFQLTQPERPLGPNPRAYGHFGAGGSLGFCDPDAGVAFAYLTNDMGPRWQNPRNRALIDAIYRCV